MVGGRAKISKKKSQVDLMEVEQKRTRLMHSAPLIWLQSKTTAFPRPRRHSFAAAGFGVTPGRAREL